MKTLALVLLASTVTTPLVAQSVERQLAAARDTVWRAYFHNDTTLLRRFIPPTAATAEGSAQMRWSTRGDIMSGSRVRELDVDETRHRACTRIARSIPSATSGR